MYYQDKVVVITGGNSGIGKCMAMDIASKGAKVIIWGRNKKTLESTCDEAKKLGFYMDWYQCDVSSKDMIYEVAGKVLKAYNQVDVLINNAGVVNGKFLMDCTDEEISNTMNVNIMASFWTVRAFLPAMEKRNAGQIVTMSSVAGLAGGNKLVDYCSSKFATFGFAESLRHELAAKGLKIKTTLICPYFVKTEMFEGVKTRFNFILPVLTPDFVARKTVTAIAKQTPYLRLPRFVMVMGLLRLLPTWAFDIVVNLFGMNQCMDEFVGHGDASTVHQLPDKKAS